MASTTIDQRKISTSCGKAFIVKREETILEAALSSNFVLEHSCKTGRCGVCKVRVKSGSTLAISNEPGLSQAEIDAGLILTCVRTAVSDLDLEIEELNNVSTWPVKTVPCRISVIERLSANVLRAILRLPPNQQFDYHPGQYVDISKGGGLSRSYSVANAPTDKRIELHIRRVPGGAMSRYWFEEAAVDDLLRLSGPKGTFFIRDAAGKNLILMATGVGIAPIKAILEGMQAWSLEQLPRSVQVYWGVRTAEDLYWNPTEIGLEFRYIPTLSRADAGWPGFRGYVQHAVLSSGIDLKNAVAYACGSLAMIEESRSELLGAGLDSRRFYSDAFITSGT